MYRVSASRNPILQVAGLLVGAVVTVGAIFVGAVLLSLFLGLAVIAGLVLFVRVWWLRRRGMRKATGYAQRTAAGNSRRTAAGEIVEVEYTVVKERPVGNHDSEQ